MGIYTAPAVHGEVLQPGGEREKVRKKREREKERGMERERGGGGESVEKKGLVPRFLSAYKKKKELLVLVHHYLAKFNPVVTSPLPSKHEGQDRKITTSHTWQVTEEYPTPPPLSPCCSIISHLKTAAYLAAARLCC